MVPRCAEQPPDTVEADGGRGDPLKRKLCVVLQMCDLLAVLESIDDTRGDDHVLDRLVDLIAEVLGEKVV